MVIRPPFPELIDNTIRQQIIDCPKKFEYATLRKLTRKGGNIHLAAGAAFAAGVEVTRRSFYHEKQPPDEALMHGLVAALEEYGDYQPTEVEEKKKHKSPHHVCRALEAYFDHYKLGEDYLIPFDTANPFEFTFAYPINVQHPETGQPILYGGRCDMLAYFRNHRDVYLDDEKTTASLGETWGPSWDLDSQFTGYTWGALESGIPAKGVIVRGISFLTHSHGFEESVQLRPAWEIHRWYQQLCKDVERAKVAWDRGDFDMRLDSRTCGKFGGCSFRDLCNKVEPERWIDMYYEPNDWSPLKLKERVRRLSFLAGD